MGILPSFERFQMHWFLTSLPDCTLSDAAAFSLVSEPVPPNPTLDAAIKRAVIAGNFEAAVECCFKFGRMADAMLLAATGGRELFEKTQDRYFELMKEQPFMNITVSFAASCSLGALMGLFIDVKVEPLHSCQG